MAIETKKFSEFADAGDLAPEQETVGVNAGVNARYNNPFPLLPPGTTAARPAIAPSMYYRLRFNTSLEQYEYYSPVTADWIQIEDSGTLIDGPFVLYTADAELPAAFNLGGLTSGILKQSVGAGIATPAIALNDVDYYGPGMTGFLQYPAGVKDINGNIIVNFDYVALGVNYLGFINNIAAGFPYIQAYGPGADVGINMQTKGGGAFQILTEAPSYPLDIYSGTAQQHLSRFIMANTANTCVYTFPDASGTIALTSGASGIINAGTINQIAYYAAAGTTLSGVGPGSTGQLFQSNGAGSAPAYTTATYPATTTANQILYSSATNTVAGLATANNGVLVTSAGGVPSISSTLPSGIAATNMALTTPLINLIKDTNGASALNIAATASAVNYLGIINNASGSAPGLTAIGADTDVSLALQTQGVGVFRFLTAATSNQYLFFSGTGFQHTTQMNFPSTAATRTVTWPDADGTVAFTSGASGIVNPGLINQLGYYAAGGSTISGLTGANQAALTTDGSGVLTWVPMIAGQILIGTTAGAPVAAAINSGTNITVANGSGTITVNLSGVVSPTLGGTGVNNGSNTLTLAGTLATVGAFASTFTMTGATNVTFPTSGTLATTAGTVSSVSGTANRITSTGGTTPVIDISASYVGQSSITTLGTIGTGVWQGTVVGSTYGGTGVNNGASTITLGGSLSTIGAFTAAFTMTGNTAVTFPTSGTLATTASASGIVNSGSQNQMAWYAANGTTVSGLSTANNGVLVTSAGGVPSISSALPAALTASNMALTTPLINSIYDSSGNPIIALGGQPTPVNYLNVINNSAGSAPGIQAVGSDTNIALALQTQGTGAFRFLTAATTNQYLLFSGSGFQHITQLNLPSSSATRTVTFTDADGTVLFAATQAEQESASSTTVGVTPGRQQYHPSAAKAWLECGLTGNILASYNVSSVADTGTGVITPSYTVSFSSTSYSIIAMAGGGSTVARICMINSYATGSSVVDCVDGAGTLADPAGPSTWNVACFGDQ
tara:strand:+ start:30484 stop:33525 length:3042 start_codon:yes stop_codon:yes gene_type:complete